MHTAHSGSDARMDAVRSAASALSVTVAVGVIVFRCKFCYGGGGVDGRVDGGEDTGDVSAEARSEADDGCEG